MGKSEDVKSLLRSGFNCAQAMMAAFAGDYGIPQPAAVKLSMNLGAGCAFRGEMCGAISTALLIYGLHFAGDQPHDELSEEIVYQLSSSHLREFTEIHGSLNCRELLGYNISNPDDFLKIIDDDLFQIKCNRFIMDSVRILERNIEETEQKMKR